jgi:FkbM family methyltransferase
LLTAFDLPAKTTVVDVGANPINGAPYAPLLQMGGCRVVGFEPQAEAFARLQTMQSTEETYFPHAVGDGRPMDLRIYKSSGMTSIFFPYTAALKTIGMGRGSIVRETIRMDTIALDDLADLPPVDLMKIDVQGAETLVFRHAERVLKNAVAVIVELRYLRLYENEPMLSGVDTELRRQGFYLHKFLFNKALMLPNSQSGRLIGRRLKDQLVDGDGVYVRNIAEPKAMSDLQLQHLGILAASVFSSHSLVLYCLDELVRRGAVPPDLPARYVDALPETLRRPE